MEDIRINVLKTSFLVGPNGAKIFSHDLNPDSGDSEGLKEKTGQRLDRVCAQTVAHVCGASDEDVHLSRSIDGMHFVIGDNSDGLVIEVNPEGSSFVRCSSYKVMRWPFQLEHFGRRHFVPQPIAIPPGGGVRAGGPGEKLSPVGKGHGKERDELAYNHRGWQINDSNPKL